MGKLSLHDLAADVAMVIEHESKGPVVVVGHAFGNWVGRMLATDRPDLVRGLVLAAASAGKVLAGVNEEYDAVAPRKFSGVLKTALGNRVTVEVIPHAGHALVPEQPNATATAIAAFARRLEARP